MVRIGVLMNYEVEIDKLKKAVANLNNTVLQMAKNNTKEVSKTDSTASEVKAITPYTETKTAYIGDTDIYFTNVPLGNVSVFGISPQYNVTRLVNDLLIEFDEPLEEVTEVTISIS